MTSEEMKRLSLAIVAVRQVVNGCPVMPGHARRAIESCQELMEMYEEGEGTQRGSRRMEVVR